MTGRFGWSRRLPTALALIALAFFAPLAAAADKIPSDQRLPADVLMYFSLHDAGELKARWSKTALSRVLADESVKPFLEQVQKQLETASAEVEGELGLGLTQVLGLPAGDLTLAVLAPKGERMSLVVIMDYGENEAALQTLLDKAAKTLEDRGAKRSEEEVDGTKLVMFREPDPEADSKTRAKKSTPTVYFLKDSHIVAGTDDKILKSILTRWDGKHEQTFAGSEVYKYLRQVCSDPDQEAPPLFTWFIDPPAMVFAALHESQASLVDPDQAPPQAALLKGVIPMLGLDKLKGIGGTLDLASGQFDTVSRTLIYAEPPPSGLLNVFQFPAAPLSPPKWIGSQAMTYFSLNWDLAKAHAAVETIYDTFQGPGTLAKILDELADDDPNVHWKKDVLDHCTGRFHLMADLPDAADAAQERMFFAVEVNDAKAMQAVLSALGKEQSFGLKGREFLGQPIYELPLAADEETEEDSDEPEDEALQEEEEKGDDPAESHLGIAVVHDHIIVANPVTLLEDILRQPDDQEPLSSSTLFQRIAKQFPERCSSINFQRQSLQLRALYEALKTLENGQGLDFSVLPKFDLIQRHMGPSGSYMRPDERGLLIHSFSLPGETADQEKPEE